MKSKITQGFDPSESHSENIFKKYCGTTPRFKTKVCIKTSRGITGCIVNNVVFKILLLTKIGVPDYEYIAKDRQCPKNRVSSTINKCYL